MACNTALIRNRASYGMQYCAHPKLSFVWQATL